MPRQRSATSRARTHRGRKGLLSLALLVLASLACSDLLGTSTTEVEMLDPQPVETETTIAVQAPVTAEPTPTATTPQPAIAPTQTKPPLSPGINMADVDVLFSYDATLFSQMEPLHEPAYVPENVDSNFHLPAYLHFVFTYAEEIDDWGFYGIQVWPAQQYAAMNSYAASTIAELQTLLDTRPALELNDEFPVLPPPLAAQWITTQAEYLTFQNGSGIRYLVQYVQAAWPVTNESLRYSFQGLTEDGKYFVTATFLASHPALPEDGDEYFETSGIDASTFQQQDNMPYRLEIAQMLNSQSPASFDPSLLSMDAMMQSLLVELP